MPLGSMNPTRRELERKTNKEIFKRFDIVSEGDFKPLMQIDLKRHTIIVTNTWKQPRKEWDSNTRSYARVIGHRRMVDYVTVRKKDGSVSRHTVQAGAMFNRNVRSVEILDQLPRNIDLVHL
jgi:hypothetical protein